MCEKLTGTGPHDAVGADGLGRSGCIYGCREAMLRAIPAAADCPQWCDEVVDQVFLQPELYGPDVFTGPMPKDGDDAKRTWAGSCAQACTASFGMRAEAGFDGGHTPCAP